MPLQYVQLGSLQEVWYGACSRLLIPQSLSSEYLHSVVIVVAEYRCVVQKSVINISSSFFIVFCLLIMSIFYQIF